MSTWPQHLDRLEQLERENADLRRRIRLMLQCVRAGAGVIELIDGRDWYISELADLRRPLPRKGKRT